MEAASEVQITKILISAGVSNFAPVRYKKNGKPKKRQFKPEYGVGYSFNITARWIDGGSFMVGYIYEIIGLGKAQCTGVDNLHFTADFISVKSREQLTSDTININAEKTTILIVGHVVGEGS